jgi:Yip1 domain
VSESPSTSGPSGDGPSAPPGAPPAEPMSVAEACFSIFFAPSRVFAERQTRDWVLPLIILTVLIALLFYGTKPYMQPAIDAEMTRAIAATARANPQLTAAQLDGIRTMQDKFAIVGVGAGIPAIVVCLAILLWIIGRFVESKQTLKAAFVVATFAYFPKVLASLAGGLIGIIRDPVHLTGVVSLTAGPGFFLDAATTSPVLLALAGRLDVFTLWITALLATGLHVTGKVPKGQAYIVAAVIWIIGALPGLFNALRAAAR